MATTEEVTMLSEGTFEADLRAVFDRWALGGEGCEMLAVRSLPIVFEDLDADAKRRVLEWVVAREAGIGGYSLNVSFEEPASESGVFDAG
jgi:hypothetical protein